MRRILLALLVLARGARASEDHGAWPELQPLFPSMGGGGVMIEGYRPVVAGDRCATAFQAVEPDGSVRRNEVVFDAVPAQGGVLRTNGRWRSLESDASGTMPFRVFIRDGTVRGEP